MSVTYRTVGWNGQKLRYDAVVWLAVFSYLAVFVSIQALARPELTIETMLIRGLGSCAFVLLHVILCIGPLARLDRRFLPLLYNRRHLGVTMFMLSLAHGVFSIVQFHSFGTLDPLVSVLIGSADYAHISQLPFQPFGLAALAIFFLMAATSHDFWLHNLTAPVWKALHMGVYLAYTLVVLHVLFGVLQEETTPAMTWLLGAGVAGVFGLHAASALKESARDRGPSVDQRRAEGFVDVCGVDDIPERRAVTACLSGERVAVFRYDGKVSVVSSVCQHQNGPLGEGRIVENCIVCPWHGYEYFPDSGASPPPFTEKVPTFNVRIEAGRVLVDPRPNPSGTRVDPARIAVSGTTRSA